MTFWEALNWLENYKNKREFILKEINSNQSIKTEFIKGGNGITLEVNHPFTKTLYDNNSSFLISEGNQNIEVNNYLVKLGSSLLSRNFEAYIFQSEGFNQNVPYYYRLLSPVKSAFYLRNLIEDIDDRFDLEINKIKLKLSLKSSDNHHYLVIESISKVSFTEFKHLTNSVLFSLGFLKGNLIKEKELFFHTSDKTWEKCSAFFSRELNKSMQCYAPITSNPQGYSNFINDELYEFDEKVAFVSKEEINNLCCLISSNANYFLAVRLLLEIFNGSFINRPSTLFVVLEIIVDEIVKRKSKPFVEKQILVTKCIETLEKNKKSISNEDYEILLNGISQIDKKLKLNNKKYEEAFNILRLSLSIEERKCLGKRNNFFHGKIIPLDKSVKNEEEYSILEFDYHSLSQRLFTLISKLLLKKIGFSGYIINHAKLREKQSNKFFKEDYFIKI